MPVSTNHIATNTKSVTLQVGEDTLTIVYYPQRITDKKLRKLSAMDEDELQEVMEGFDSFNAMLAEIIKSWDFYEDEELTVMVPITVERLADLPIPFKRDIFGAIVEDMSGPNRKAAKIRR